MQTLGGVLIPYLLVMVIEKHMVTIYSTFNSYILITIKAIVCYKYDNLCAVHHIYVTTCIDQSTLVIPHLWIIILVQTEIPQCGQDFVHEIVVGRIWESFFLFLAIILNLCSLWENTRNNKGELSDFSIFLQVRFAWYSSEYIQYEISYIF